MNQVRRTGWAPLWLAGWGIASTVCAMPGAALAAQGLNDTGVTLCVHGLGRNEQCAGTGQDGQAGRDVSARDGSDGDAGFSFVKLDAAGKRLPADATAWTCLGDKVTGLAWEMKTADGGEHDLNRHFTNFGDGRPGDASAFAASANEQALCGKSDWRLPTRGELLGIVHYATRSPGPAIDTAWFPNGDAYSGWTSSGVAGNSFAAWYVNFHEGYIANLNRDYAFGSVRLVSGESAAPAPSRYVYEGDEVTDTVTRLVWRRCSEGQRWTGSTCEGVPATGSWAKARRQAELEAARTGVAWRLPNVKELQSLVTDDHSRPAIDVEAFPGTRSKWYWSSTPYSSLPFYAWSVFFLDGATNFVMNSEPYAARLVRDAR
ncbi:MAG TPA: DUF1566 domain-containing protein [Ideonella sp.]|nr:DUF1566 domain-containing protein [Ideonella sp.]